MYSKTPRNSRSKGFYYMIRGKMMSNLKILRTLRSFDRAFIIIARGKKVK